MTITYPLAFPSLGVASVRITQNAVVAVSKSPFTGTEQVQEHQGQWFECEISIPPMYRADYAEWDCFFLQLNGRSGTFLTGDSSYRVPRGTVAGTVLINGSHSARSKTLAVKGMTAGTTLLKSDYIQLGTGSTARLHKVISDATADGSGNATLDIWPALTTSYANGDPVTYNSPVGVFRLTSNQMAYEANPGIIFSGMVCAARSVT
jgi:hypothetical protein